MSWLRKLDRLLFSPPHTLESVLFQIKATLAARGLADEAVVTTPGTEAGVAESGPTNDAGQEGGAPGEPGR